MEETKPARSILADRPNVGRLVVYTPGQPARVLPYAGGTIDMGRDPSCGLCLRDDRSSRVHARIKRRRDSGLVEVEDQNSSNGTFVDGERITLRILEDGSVVRVGDSLLLYEITTNPDTFHNTPLRSLASEVLRQQVSDAAAIEAPVLLIGETGAGKGHYAKQIGKTSGRSGEFIHVNCAALPKDLAESELFGHVRGAFSGASDSKVGLLEAANGGTVFLDEIGACSKEIQAKLLTSIEERTVRQVGSTRSKAVDVRFLAATNLDLDTAIVEGEFRQDLFFRLAAMTIEIPPLNKRRADIIPLLGQQLDGCDHRAFTAEALETLLVHRWPGNVRELLNLAQLLPRDRSEPIDYLSLPKTMLGFLKERQEEKEGASLSSKMPPKDFLITQLAAANGNVSELARRLGKHRTQVVRWLDALGIDR